ncbi:tetratricopeptide (TPR) repeat protein [Paenibacillus rhizosphaerae]|uniref:Tetratricopeptide (TPR) repeat protein n=1 Tax=Paenibacillus rhizosphaerae TaxID=297318 RepID=A0A839TIW0_9BACL|nr:WG repeat-containing protein [Paenibacillus rhizosphaerae]MBB3126572.1 tetratricopeptide (TPR) repeat protein [Paenibacillus rhizosphaerae]
MNVNESQSPVQLVNTYLPEGAELVTMSTPAGQPAVIAEDVTGDRIPEISAVYRLDDVLYLLVLKFSGGVWRTMARIQGPGYGVTLLTAAPVTKPERNNLLVGWQIGSIWSKLSVYEWTEHGLTDVAPTEMSYSYIDVSDWPGPGGPDGRAELALWIHDTGEAYRTEVLRWRDGSFHPAEDVYPAYYPEVARYYERMTESYPDYPFYWYYLAEAQYRAGIPQAALHSVRRALGFAQPYPSREALLTLERKIMQLPRVAELLRFSARTAEGIRWGYINTSGKMVIPARYEDAKEFQKNGLAIVRERGKYGLIDQAGVWIVAPVYDSISPFSEHRAVVTDGGDCKLIDEQGKVVTKSGYSYIADMREGRSVFCGAERPEESVHTGRYGYLDSQGYEIIPARYEEAGDFGGGKAWVKMKDGEYALIGLDGRSLYEYEFEYAGPPGDGLLVCQQQAGGKYGYVDLRGQVRIQPVFTSASPFRRQRAIVNTAESDTKRYGVIDDSGQFVVPPEYHDILDLGEERLALARAVNPEQPSIGLTYAIADWEGRLLTDFGYTRVSEYQNGLASVTDAKATYLIDSSGSAAPGYPMVEGRGSLTLKGDGLIEVQVARRMSYLTRDGRTIWRDEDPTN